MVSLEYHLWSIHDRIMFAEFSPQSQERYSNYTNFSKEIIEWCNYFLSEELSPIPEAASYNAWRIANKNDMALFKMKWLT